MGEMLAGMGGGGLLGIGKYIGDVQANANDRALNAAIMKYSPWTKMKPGDTRKANAFQDIAGGAGAGASFAQKNPNFLAQMGLGGEGGGEGGAVPGMGGGGYPSLGVDTSMPGAAAGGAGLSPWAALAAL